MLILDEGSLQEKLCWKLKWIWNERTVHVTRRNKLGKHESKQFPLSGNLWIAKKIIKSLFHSILSNQKCFSLVNVYRVFVTLSEIYGSRENPFASISNLSRVKNNWLNIQDTSRTVNDMLNEYLKSLSWGIYGEFWECLKFEREFIFVNFWDVIWMIMLIKDKKDKVWQIHKNFVSSNKYLHSKHFNKLFKMSWKLSTFLFKF